MANHREGVNRRLRDCPTLVLRLRTFPTLQIHLQQLAPISLLGHDHHVRYSQERRCDPAIGLFSNVRIHRKVLVRGIHDSTPPVNDRGYQGATVRYSLDEVEDGECGRHDDDLRVVVEPG